MYLRNVASAEKPTLLLNRMRSDVSPEYIYINICVCMCVGQKRITNYVYTLYISIIERLPVNLLLQNKLNAIQR